MTLVQNVTRMPDLGLTEEEHKGVVELLRNVLADEHVLYLKLRKFHWNITGPQFRSLHELFEEQYSALETTIDEVAELIVQYGAIAPGTMKEFIESSRLSEEPGSLPDSLSMVREIVDDHEKLIRFLRTDVNTAGEKYHDIAVEDFLTGLVQKHQKQAWMLRAMIEGEPVHN